MALEFYNESAIDLLRQQLSELLALMKGLQEPNLLKTKAVYSHFITNFDINSDTLTDHHIEQLTDLAELILLEPALEIDMLIGRASQTGNEDNNQRLSETRAQAVADYLSVLGIQPTPSTIGSGSTAPLVDLPNNESTINRSVEIQLWYDLSLIANQFDTDPAPTPSQLNIQTYEYVWEKQFKNLTDQEIHTTWEQFKTDDLSPFENSKFHTYFIITILNVALEKARREPAFVTHKQIVGRAWSLVQNDIRGDTNTAKPDPTNTIYRDAERFLEIASATFNGVFFSDNFPMPGGYTQMAMIPIYDPIKALAWGIYDGTDNSWLLEKLQSGPHFPSRPGGFDWALMGSSYTLLYRDNTEPTIVELPIGTRELVQQELLNP